MAAEELIQAMSKTKNLALIGPATGQVWEGIERLDECKSQMVREIRRHYSGMIFTADASLRKVDRAAGLQPQELANTPFNKNMIGNVVNYVTTAQHSIHAFLANVQRASRPQRTVSSRQTSATSTTVPHRNLRVF